MSLFALGEITLSSGRTSGWKIECDALDSGDWDALAMLGSFGMPSFAAAFGVPSGGKPFERALQKYASGNSPYVLVCDDVWTTGRSMEEMRAQMVQAGWELPKIHGLVAFSRAPSLPYWVRAIFSLSPAIAQVTP